MLLTVSLISLISFTLSIGHRSEARTEQIFDGNKNLKLSMEAPNEWNSGIISQTISKLNWRFNGLTATEDDLSAFFAVVNLPSLANMALPLGEKTGLLSLIISHYVTVNGESDITLNDGSKAHRYSITVTTEQLHNLKAPLDKGFDAVLLTTNQLGGSYIIIYAAQQGRLNEFNGVMEKILSSVKFGSVGFSGTTSELNRTLPTPSSQSNYETTGKEDNNTIGSLSQTIELSTPNIIKPTEQVRIPANLIDYSNTGFRFKIKYPTDWNKEVASDHVSFISPQGFPTDYAERLDIQYAENVLIFETEQKTLEEHVKAVINNHTETLKGFRLLSSQSTTLNGFPAQQLVYTYENYVVGSVKVKEIVVIDGDRRFIIVFTAKPNQYDSALPLADKIIKTLTFT